MDRNTGWITWKLILISCFLIKDAISLQYTPVALNGVGDGECALLLNGPGRSSSYDYNLNLLRGNGFGYNGPHTCITYDAVNAAYLEARKRIQVAQPHGDYKPEDVATVGELLLDISVNLARTYGLTYEDIEKGLPLIDTSRTLIREVCPPYLSNVECRPGKYRRLDGLCTNLENPTWGSTNTPFTRLIGPLYADGMTAPRISVTGNQLPLARVVSRTMHPDEGFHDHAGTVMVIAWGQFIDHDYTLTATPLDPLNRNDPEECCKRPPHLRNPYCNEIIIPEDDYFYRLFGVRCMDFVRGFPAARPGCRLDLGVNITRTPPTGSRSQFNTLTGVLDANTVYGVSEKFSRKLRSGYGGQLRMNPVFREYGLKDLLPLKLDIPDEGCTRPNRSMYCFEAGEIRVNEQLVLTCMHTLMAREHNRVAEGLAQVNPHWDDETLFQEARRINIAEVQHITYNEFLPILLGKEVMEKFGLLLQKDGYWDGYDPTVNPNVIDAFAAAAYRFGHSLLPTAVERWSKAHKFIASKRLSDLIRRPYDLYRAGVFDEYFMGLMNQVAQAMDDSITQEVTNHLFKKAGARYGMDLVSFNMQRGREFGLPGYMEFRKFCGLPGADTFGELFGSMPNETIKRYSTIFEHPHDVDLWSGGVSERPLPGSMLGPTFACIIATQFSYSRRGDRFWFELPNQPSSFTPEQLHEIRKARLARVICDNTDLIDTIQLYPMVLPDHEINPRVPCRSGVLPSIDFSKWADHGSPQYHQQQQPFTNPIKIAPRLSKLTEETLYKNIESNIHGKHPYAPLFKSQPIKNIRILPPIVLPPAIITNEIISKKRRKRNTANTKKLDKNSETNKNEDKPILLPRNRTKFEHQNNSTESPVDQATQAITVNQISGTPPSKININSQDLNFQPFAITSSDFKDTPGQNFGQLQDIEDVGKLIQKKLEEISQPGNYYNEEKDTEEENENYEDDNEEEKTEDDKENYEENDEDHNTEKEKENYEENDEDRNTKKDKENYEEENGDIEEAENLEEADENEDANPKEELNENKENYDEQNEEIINEDEENRKQFENAKNLNEKLIIFVPDQQENEPSDGKLNEDPNDDLNEEQNEKQSEDQNEEPNEELVEEDAEEETQNLERERAPEIPESFVRHFVELGAYEPEEETQESKDNNKQETLEDDNNQETLEDNNKQETLEDNNKQETLETTKENNEEFKNLKIKQERFYAPLEVEEQTEESNEEIKEKYKYFDDILNHQLEENLRLQKELEYPELDKEYDKFRESASNSYLQSKEADFDEVSRPYIINLKGDFPYDEQNNYGEEDNRTEHNFKDDVDVGTDKERLHKDKDEDSNEEINQNEDDNEEVHNNEESNQNENKKQYQDDTSAEDEHEQYQEQEQEEDNEKREQYQDEPEEENEKVYSQKQYTIVPAVNHGYKLHNWENTPNFDGRNINSNTPNKDVPSSSQKQFVSTPSKKIDSNRNNILKNTQNKVEEGVKQNKEEHIAKEETINEEIHIETTTENVIDALDRILAKKDAFSRQQEVERPREYNTFWKLEYRNPNPK